MAGLLSFYHVTYFIGFGFPLHVDEGCFASSCKGGIEIEHVAVLLTLPLGDKEFAINFKTIITWIAALAILLALLFEDRMNGYVARKRMLAGMDRATTAFNDESYITTTSIGKTEFPYDRNIDLLAETKDYFVFVFDKSHAQVYDKHALAGGTLEEFRKFISEKTGKEIVHVA